MTTAWYQPVARFGIFVTGYPKTRGNSLAVELESGTGVRRGMPLDVADVGESWQFLPISVGPANGIARLRIRAVDGSGARQGWLGFSEPVQDDEGILKSIEEVLRIVLAIMASVTFLLGPGLALRAAIATADWNLPLIWIPVPGTVLLTLWGLSTWVLRLNRLPDARGSIAYALEAALLVAYLKWRDSVAPEPAQRKVFFLFLLVVVIACGKGLYSLGPAGELYAGTVSRSNEVGDRSDSRVPFHIVQLAVNGLPLESPESQALFAPYFPTSRGPITGLVASPVVLLSGAAVPTVEMDQPWRPFDLQGFMAYRILMTCLAATSLFAFYGLAQALTASNHLALLGTAMLALSPFFVHETYFTWPKLAATGFVLLSFYCVLLRRVVQAGLVMGFAYLIHPLALLSIPPFALLIVVIQIKRAIDRAPAGKIPWRRMMELAIPGVISALTGCAVCIGFFFAWNQLSGGPSQDSTFLSYLVSTNGTLCHSVGAWLRDRTISVLNTIVPLFLFVFFRDDFRVNSIWGPSPSVVQFYFSYWNTLPFGIGICFFVPVLYWLVQLAWRCWAAFAGFIVMPFALFAIYWGSSHSGLMREGLQPWFLMLFLFLMWGMHRVPETGIAIATLIAKIQILRVAELLAMLLLPCLLTRHQIVTPRFAGSDTIAIGFMVVGSALLGRATWSAAHGYAPGQKRLNPRICKANLPPHLVEPPGL